jgi:hypothetical protein
MIQQAAVTFGAILDAIGMVSLPLPGPALASARTSLHIKDLLDE